MSQQEDPPMETYALTAEYVDNISGQLMIIANLNNVAPAVFIFILRETAKHLEEEFGIVNLKAHIPPRGTVLQ